MADHPTASELFLRGLERLSRAFQGTAKKDEPTIQTTEAFKRQRQEHEERRKKIADAIASGARISRRRS
jgi:hypothetical protein